MDLNSPDERSYETQQVLEIAATWEHNRSLYPGWVVLPPQNRRDLWQKTENWIPYVEEHLSELKFGEQIWVLDELIWRVQRCLRPLNSDLRDKISEVFHTGQESDWVDEADGEALRRWLRIGLALMRVHRWNGEVEKLNLRHSDLEEHVTSFPDLRSGQQYQKILHHLGQGDIETVTNHLESWEVPDSLPLWKIKRAGVHIDLGNTRKGLREINDALDRIRQSVDGKNPSYRALSTEGFALLIRDFSRRARQEPRSSSVNRWTQLANRRADIRTQVEDLMEQVQSSSPGLPEESYVYEDPLTGQLSGRFNLGDSDSGINEAVQPGYELASYLESGGIPLLYCFPHWGGTSGTISQLKSLPKWLRGAYPWYTLTLLIRMRRKTSETTDVLKYHLSFGPLRYKKGNWSELYSKAQFWADSCLARLKELRERYEKHSHDSIARYKTFLGILQLLVPFLPRGCKEEAVEMATEIYQNEENGHLQSELRDLFSRLFSWSDGATFENHIRDLLRVPDANELSRNCDPFQIGSLDKLKSGSGNFEVDHPEDSESVRQFGAVQDGIEKLIRKLNYVLAPLHSEQSRDDLNWYLADKILWRLLRLRRANLLSRQQINRVVKLIWRDEGKVRLLVSHTDLKIDQILSLVGTNMQEVDLDRISRTTTRVVRRLNYKGNVFENEEKPNIRQVFGVINTSEPQDPKEKREVEIGSRAWVSWTPEDIEPILEWVEGTIESVNGHRFGPITQTDQLGKLPFGSDLDEEVSKAPVFVAKACVPALRRSAVSDRDSHSDFEDRVVDLVHEMIDNGIPARSALSCLYRLGRVDEQVLRESVNEGLMHQEFSAQIDAAEAVYRFCVFPGAEGKTRLLDVLIRNVMSLATGRQGAFEGVVRWLQRCVRDAPNAVGPQQYSDLCTVLRVVSDHMNPPTDRERVEARNDKERRQLSRWIQQRVQSAKLGVWLTKIRDEIDGDALIRDKEPVESINCGELTKSIAEMYPHPQIIRAFNRTIEEAGLGDTFDSLRPPREQ